MKKPLSLVKDPRRGSETSVEPSAADYVRKKRRKPFGLAIAIAPNDKRRHFAQGAAMKYECALFWTKNLYRVNETGEAVNLGIGFIAADNPEHRLVVGGEYFGLIAGRVKDFSKEGWWESYHNR